MMLLFGIKPSRNWPLVNMRCSHDRIKRPKNAGEEKTSPSILGRRIRSISRGEANWQTPNEVWRFEG